MGGGELVRKNGSEVDRTDMGGCNGVVTTGALFGTSNEDRRRGGMGGAGKEARINVDLGTESCGIWETTSSVRDDMEDFLDVGVLNEGLRSKGIEEELIS